MGDFLKCTTWKLETNPEDAMYFCGTNIFIYKIVKNCAQRNVSLSLSLSLLVHIQKLTVVTHGFKNKIYAQTQGLGPA